MIEVEVDNRSGVDVDEAGHVALARAVLEREGVSDGELGIQFVGPAESRALKLEHLDIDEATDVLSFPYDEGEAIPVPEGFEDEEGRYLGDIAISLETAARQAKTARITLDEEVQHIVLHGVLHLLGYDHETPEEARDMEEREERRLGTHIHGGPQRRGPAHTD